MMKKSSFEFSQLPNSVVRDLANRDVVLWVGEGFDKNEDDIGLLLNLIELPWRMVLCEANSQQFSEALEAHSKNFGRFTRWRGFLHIVATDPEGIELPRRTLPVFMLNGREGTVTAEESSSLPRNAALRRKLNMFNELNKAKVKQLIVLSKGAQQQLNDLNDLWDEGFRSYLHIIFPPEQKTIIYEWLKQFKSSNATLYPVTIHEIVLNLIDKVSVEIPEDRLLIRVQHGKKELIDFDITECELIEQPLLDRYELVRSHQLQPLLPEDLKEEDLIAFFSKSMQTWTPFAAGLPWDRGHSERARSHLFNALHKVEKSGPEENKILYVTSDPGAGGTTFLHYLAFQAASHGYPTLVAQQAFFRPDSTEIASFLFRVRQKFIAQYDAQVSNKVDDKINVTSPLPNEIPWVIVFDVIHWKGHEEGLKKFLGDLTRSGRPVVIIIVVDNIISDELLNNTKITNIFKLTHEISQEDVLSLGQHLNKFLRVYGKEKSEQEWFRFWENHRPRIDISIASFWIALEFWLKGQLDLSESIQSWIYRHFKETPIENDLRKLLLEIAAMTVELHPLPESLMPLPTSGAYPYSVLLENIRNEIPALALTRVSVESQRQWAMAHDLIGRYLISSTFFDYNMRDMLGFAEVEDHIHLRLMLLRQIATCNAIGEKINLPLALEFAVNILKLDTDGSPEFFKYWRLVLDILENMPQIIRKTSRIFNHHVAISRRRVAISNNFDASDQERKIQLEKAIDEIEYAINYIERRHLDDESNLNLFNSLSLAYQNLATLVGNMGLSQDLINEYRRKADEATKRALSEDPTNSYVLETAAKNLIQKGRLHKNEAITASSEALGYIFQAVALDYSDLRQSPLTKLANDALQLLRSEGSDKEINRLCESENPLGYIAKAWLVLAKGLEEFTSYKIGDLPIENVTAALQILKEFPSKSHWLLLRFRYDLVSVAKPSDFDEQLRILDELEGTAYRMPFQLQLEYAILLYQRHRPFEANNKFKHLRDDLKKYDAVVAVPRRLRWLVNDNHEKQICVARVTEDTGYKAWAKVKELKNANVPFIPQEFGERRLPLNFSFNCYINFGPMGPFIRPPQDKEDHS